MGRKILGVLVVISLSASSVLTQQRIHIRSKYRCSFYATDPIDNSEEVYGFNPDKDAETAVARILSYTGVKQNFVIRAANVPNAEAVRDGTTRYILYNQEFMQKLVQTARTDWAAVGIMAHEIGHHLNGDTLDENAGSMPELELAADKFAGSVMNRMGATLEQAKSAFGLISSEKPKGNTHPPRSARLVAVTNGWMEAENLGRKPVVTNKPDTTPKAIMIRTPEVKSRLTDYREYTFEPGDEVLIEAGGCVQTGGSGRTWKRYVDPIPSNMYYGTIQLPGFRSPEPIAKWVGRKYTIPNASSNDLFLLLGYEDDNYSDNGYHDRNSDDGIGDQCKGLGDAYVKLTIYRNPR